MGPPASRGVNVLKTHSGLDLFWGRIDQNDPMVSIREATARPSHERRTDATIFRIALGLASLPILIAAVRNGLNGWFPFADAGITAVRTNDIFSAHPPLVGLPASTSVGSAEPYSYLGAPINYVLAVPVRLFGISWGIVLGMGALNTAWFVTAMWLVRRRLGYRLATVYCVIGASLLWGVGSQMLIDPTPVQLGVTASLLLLVSAWSVADGDAFGLIPLGIVANFLLLDHLKFVVLVPILCVGALIGWAANLVASRREHRDTWPKHVRLHRKHFVVALLASLVLWIPSLVQQIFTSDGNISLVVNGLTASDSSSKSGHGLFDTIRVISSPITTWPLWFRDSFAHPNFSLDGPTTPIGVQLIGFAFVGVCLAWVLISARKRSDTTVLSMIAISVLAWAAWTVSGLLDLETTWTRRYYRGMWPVAVFVWCTLIVGMYRAGWPTRLTSRISASRKTVGASLLATMVFVAASIPIANLGAETPQTSIPKTRNLEGQIAANVPRGSDVLVNIDMRVWPYLPAVLLGLQRRGIAFRFDSRWALRTYGTHRAVQLPNPRLLEVRSKPDRPEQDLVAISDPHMSVQLSTAFKTGKRIHAWLHSLNSVTLPLDTPVTPAQRRFINEGYTTMLRRANESGASVLDQPDFVKSLATTQIADARNLFRPPFLTSSQFQNWLDLHWKMLTGAFVFVYLDN